MQYLKSALKYTQYKILLKLMFPVTLLVFSILPSLSMLKYICLFLSMSAYVCVKEREREWWGRRMPFCYIWKSFLLGDSTRFGLYQLVIAKTKPLRFPPSWLLSKHLEERQKKNEKRDKKSFTTILAIAGRITKPILLRWRGHLE